jgi:hypothetical protein
MVGLSKAARKENQMSQRLDYFKQSPKLSNKLLEFGNAVKSSSLGNTLIDLVNIRASQLNGCAFLSRYALQRSQDPR